MKNNKGKNDSIKLTLPIDPAYVTAARLTASSVSERMGFHSEAEDVKAAVSEACIFIINHCSQGGADRFCIEFSTLDSGDSSALNSEMLIVRLTTPLNDTVLATSATDTLGMQMMQALMNSVEIIFEDGGIGIKMTKRKSIIRLTEGD